MVSIEPFKSASERRKNAPVIIGIPGFVSKIHGGRIHDVLETLSQEGFVGYAISQYTGTHEDGKRIEVPFNLESYIQDVEQLFDFALSETANPRINIFASSIGASVLTHFLARTKRLPNITSYVSVAPFLGTKRSNKKDFPKVNGKTQKIPRYIPITTQSDKKAGIKRIIPGNSKPQLDLIDALEAAKNSRDIAYVQTHIATKDRLVEQASAEKYHLEMGGVPEDRYLYKSGHDISHEESRDRILNFFRTYN